MIYTILLVPVVTALSIVLVGVLYPLLVISAISQAQVKNEKP